MKINPWLPALILAAIAVIVAVLFINLMVLLGY